MIEPGRQGLTGGELDFCDNPGPALKDADVLWVAFDTPVDDNDVADTDFVKKNMMV